MATGCKPPFRIGTDTPDTKLKVMNWQLSYDRPEITASKANQVNAFANAKRGYERYVTLAKASLLSGDAVVTENYYQHADHYLRERRRFVGE